MNLRTIKVRLIIIELTLLSIIVSAITDRVKSKRYIGKPFNKLIKDKPY